MGVPVPDTYQVSVPGGGVGYIPVWGQQTTTKPAVTAKNEQPMGTTTEAEDPVAAYYKWLKDQQTNQNLGAVKAFFTAYGMDKLWAGAEALVRQGYTDPDAISMMLSQDKNYQKAYFARFPAVQKIREINKQRIAEGKAPIAEPNPGTYVQLEQGYRAALHGLPEGAFGSAEQMADWIVKEKSPQEIADQVAVAKNYINYQANDYVKTALRNVYGMTDTEMVAYVLGGEKTVEFLQTQWQRRMAQSNVLGASAASGIGVDGLMADQIGQTAFGSSFDAAMGGFRNVAEQVPDWQRLGRIYNSDNTTGELITENFGLGGGAEVTTKKNKLASAERAAFGGSSAIARGSLSQRSLGQQ